MERNGRIFCKILIISGLILSSCGLQDYSGNEIERDVEISIGISGLYPGKSAPPEDMIDDLSILIFDEYGKLEKEIWFESGHGEIPPEYSISLVSGRKYTFCSCANTGFQIRADDLKSLEAIEYNMAYPDEYSHGIPMSGRTGPVRIGRGDEKVNITLERLMAKISLRIDRSRLAPGVELDVTGVKIGNCPKKVSMFAQGRISDPDECFIKGFSLAGSDVSSLNRTDFYGMSEDVSLYMLENMHGTFRGIDKDEEKVLSEDDPRYGCASYMEISMTYLSEDAYTMEKDLKYRFYLGGSRNDLNVERNCHYRITVTPEDDGLKGSGWRVDKSGIHNFIKEIRLSDNTLSFNYIGESKALTSTILPEDDLREYTYWESSDKSVAEVSDKGRVTAVGEGECIIRCMSDDGSGAGAECFVTVKEAPYSFRMIPSGYMEGKVGDRLHLRCEFFPPDAPFDIGMEELEFDKARGLYDYLIDEDGHGVTLLLKSPGSGIVYMSAGAPINSSDMAVILITE